MIARYRFATALCVALLLLLPFSLFLSVTVGRATLLPVDNLFAWQPFHSLAASLGVGTPQNGLLSDLILENYPWKRFILDSIHQGEIPLWNPYLFAGIPFLAAGQHSALYPLSLLYYLLPLDRAYGWFTVLNLGLAGVFLFILMRVLGFRNASATLAGVTYQLSGFMIVSVVFPMIIAAAAWLPLILAMAELVIRQQPFLRGRPASAPWAFVGALAIAMHILAGHIEITLYTALIVGFYCVWRLVQIAIQGHGRAHASLPSDTFSASLPASLSAVTRPAIWLAAMAVLGAGIAGIQLLPLYEVVQTSFRTARSSLAQVMSYGFPLRHILLWLMPNFYGNPAHHTYFDIFSWSTQPVRSHSGNTDWGIKNYVEGGAYVGIITLILAGITTVRFVNHLVRQHRERRQDAGDLEEPAKTANTTPEFAGHPGFFIVLGLLSVGFMFGTPLYAILFYGLPGINQLNSPFRWVYAFTLCLAVLAGMGMDWLLSRQGIEETSLRQGRNPGQTPGHAESITGISPSLLSAPRSRDWLRMVSVVCIIISALIVGCMIVVRLAWGFFDPIITRLYTHLAKAPEAFPTAEAFFSYEARNLVIFAVLLAASGVLLMLARRLTSRVLWSVLVIGLLAIDLNLAWVGFNPSADPRLLKVSPPALQFLQSDKSLWRLTTYEPPGSNKPLNANSAWLYGLQDIRGYDSIIPHQYVSYMELIESQNDLLYNRIAPVYHENSLQSPLLDLLGVKYVMTEQPFTIKVSGFKQVYEDSGVRIYQNQRAMPRAWTLPATSAFLTHDFGKAVQSMDPRQYVMLDATCGITDTGCVVPHPAVYTPATITLYKNDEVWVDVQITQTSWLVLADSFYPGWRAWVRPLGGTDKDEHEVEIGLADGNFRAVKLQVPGSTDSGSATKPGVVKGQVSGFGSTKIAPSQASQPVGYTVRFKYFPDSFRLGIFASFISLVALLLIIGIYLWRSLYHEGLATSPVRRVAKNSLVLTSFNLAGRLIDFAFAILMLRVLGPNGAGNYAFAIVVIGWFDILMNFGLNTFLTREVARDKEHANKYLYNTSVLRLLLGLGSAPLVAVVIVVWRHTFGMSNDTAIAIALLAVSQMISSMATGLSAVFFAHEKAEFPAALTIVSSLVKVSLGTLALLAGFGIVGLAGVSIVTNLVTVTILLAGTMRMFFVPQPEGDPAMRRGMLRESFPLMLNNLLSTLFFKVDVPLLEAMRGSTVVGWYTAAYKYMDAFNVIPAFFTLSIFPAMSRMARQDDNTMARSYTLSVKLLVMMALPLAVLSTALAYFMIGLLGGTEFLPHGAIALSIMIWSIPFGWVNSVTNYALIAVNQQRALTRAFIIGLVFNVIANLILIPLYSYQAAAVVTIFSEVVEGAAFYFYVRRYIVRVPWLNVLGRPLVATAAMATVIYLLANAGLLVAGLVAGCVVYVLALLAVGALSADDRLLLAPLMPERVRRAWVRPERA